MTTQTNSTYAFGTTWDGTRMSSGAIICPTIQTAIVYNIDIHSILAKLISGGGSYEPLPRIFLNIYVRTNQGRAWTLVSTVYGREPNMVFLLSLLYVLSLFKTVVSSWDWECWSLSFLDSMVPWWTSGYSHHNHSLKSHGILWKCSKARFERFIAFHGHNLSFGLVDLLINKRVHHQ